MATKSKDKTEGAMAVIEATGKQYLVSAGDIIDLRMGKIGVPEAGKSIVFDNVLLKSSDGSVELGAPYIKGATVTGKVEDLKIKREVISMRYRSKSRYHTKRGYRESLVRVKIEKIA